MSKKIFVKTLLTTSTVGLLGGGIASSLTLTSCSNKSEKALEIDTSTPTITNEGTTLNISGSYSTFNFNSPTIEFASGTSEWFSELIVDDANKTFTTTLRSDNHIGDYVLQLVAMKGNDSIFSNEIHFTVGPFATSDGSNWAGHTSGTVDMALNENMTATIFRNINYVAENLVIPEYVFKDGKFYKVTIINMNAFNGCTGLTGSLTIPNSVTSINTYAFRNCRGLTGSLTIGSGVNSIGNYAFAACGGLTGSLTIPNSVESIGNYAFADCSGLTGSLTIGSGVNSIGNSAFAACRGLKGSLTIPNSVTNIGNFAFESCSRLTGSLTIGSGVNSIGDYAFYRCSGLTGSLIIPDSVESIGDYAFADCSGLTGSLTIGSYVTSIGDYAFRNCSGLTGSLTIPDSVTSIEYGAFSVCNFDDILIDIDGMNPTYGLAINVGDAKIVVEKDSQGVCSKDYDSDDIAGSLAIGQLTIPGSVNSIGNYAFEGCSGLTGSLTIPDSVTSIGAYAFSLCSGLTGSLTIPGSVESIGNYTFADCSGLTGSLTIGSGVNSIGNFAFDGCSGFTNITLDGYDEVPIWDVGSDIFYEWNNDSHSTVSSSNGSLSAGDALDYLQGIGFPPNWTVLTDVTVSDLQANGISGTESSTALTFTTSVEITGLNSDDIISSISTVDIGNVSYDSGIYTVAISGMWNNSDEITLTIVKSGYRIEGSLTTVLNLAPISLNISIITQPTDVSYLNGQTSTNLVITESTHTFDDWDNISLELTDTTTPANCVAFVDSANVDAYTKTFTIKTSSTESDYQGENQHTIISSLHYSNQGVDFNLTFGNINEFLARYC